MKCGVRCTFCEVRQTKNNVCLLFRFPTFLKTVFLQDERGCSVSFDLRNVCVDAVCVHDCTCTCVEHAMVL